MLFCLIIKKIIPAVRISLLAALALLIFQDLEAVSAEEKAEIHHILTLQEAAHLLRVNQHDVLRLVEEDCLPGRKIGNQWRFYRKALLEWLTLKGSCQSGVQSPDTSAEKNFTDVSAYSLNHSSTGPADILNDRKDLMLEAEMTSVTGRGTVSSGSNAEAASEKSEQIGERPDFATAEDVLLRGEQVLLKADEATFELGLFYSKTEQQGLTVVPVDDLLLLAFSEGELDRYIANFTLRYGVRNDLQISASAPLIYQRETVTARAPGMTNAEEKSDSRSELGDIIVGLRHTVIEEGMNRPDVILSVEGHIPTGKSSFGIAGGISVLKRSDPAVLYANLDYRRVFSREFDDPTRLQPENILGIGVGWSISLNDRLAINNSVTGTFTTRTTFDDPALPDLEDSEIFNFKAGLTSLLREELYIDTFVSFALNGPRNVTVGISVPYTFNFMSPDK